MKNLDLLINEIHLNYYVYTDRFGEKPRLIAMNENTVSSLFSKYPFEIKNKKFMGMDIIPTKNLHIYEFKIL